MPRGRVKCDMYLVDGWTPCPNPAMWEWTRYPKPRSNYEQPSPASPVKDPLMVCNDCREGVLAGLEKSYQMGFQKTAWKELGMRRVMA